MKQNALYAVRVPLVSGVFFLAGAVLAFAGGAAELLGTLLVAVPILLAVGAVIVRRRALRTRPADEVAREQP